MRDTIIFGLFLAGLTFGYYHFRTTASVPSHPTTAMHDLKKGKASRVRNQGVQNERTASESNLSSEASAASEGASGEDSEVAVVPSIYSKPSPAKQSKSRIGRKTTKRPTIGGFDAEAYVASRKNDLHQTRVVADSDQGLRVFLMCMEVKKGAVESTSDTDCRALYQDSVAARLSGKNGRF